MTIQMIEVKKLSKSPYNVRKTANNQALDELKASIHAHGLMQNLVVVPAKKGRYEVIAGARRLEAIIELLAEGKLKGGDVPCQVVSIEQAEEMSLAENIVRLAMHPADQFEAFAALADKGQSSAQIAERFGTSEKLVLQRLKLGRVAPELLVEYRAGNIKLESLMAFTVTEDREKQVSLYRGLNSWQKDNPHHIRESLTEGSISSDDKLAKFVGLDTYEAAGGRTRSDLFGERTYLEDAALLNRLAGEKLEAEAEKLRAEGWGWVVVDFEEDTAVTRRSGRIEPVPLDAPAELMAELEEAKTERRQIEEALDDTESDALIDAQDEIENRIEALESRLESYVDFDPEQKKLAGCFVSISWSGKLDVEKGLVKPEDKKAVAQTQPEGEEPDEAPAEKPGLSQAVIDDLKAYRTQVAQVALAENPDIAFDLLVTSAARQVLSKRAIFDGPDILFRESHVRPSGGEKTAAVEHLEAIKVELPLEWMREKTEAAQFTAFQRLNRDDKDRILAYCTAMTLRPKLAPAAGKQQSVYDAALAQTGVKVVDYWRPTAANFLSRIKVAQLLEIGRAVFPGGSEWAARNRDKKKAALVTELDQAFAKSANPDTLDAIREWLPEGMAFAAPKAEAGQAESEAA